MPIVLFRVDERLIHGQVVVGWGGPLHADRMVVVDDELAASPWEQELYCLGVPPEIEAAFTASERQRQALFPPDLPRVILSHTRPEPMLGLLRRLDGGPKRTTALGYISRGGTLDVPGMLFANRCTWAHAVGAAAGLLEIDTSTVLGTAEIAAIEGRHHPRVLAEETEPKRKTR